MGLYEAACCATSMDLTEPRIAASVFAILMTEANVGAGAGLAASGALSNAVGCRWTFILIAALNLLALPLTAPIFGGRRAAHEWTRP